MADKLSVFLDINIVLDVLQKREPFYAASAQVLSLIESKKMDGLMASHSVTTLFYLIKKGKSTSQARAVLTNLLQFLKIVAVDQNTIEQALNLDYPDFEDAVQMIAALQNQADYLITRNVADFQPPVISVIQPVDFLAIVH